MGGVFDHQRLVKEETKRHLKRTSHNQVDLHAPHLGYLTRDQASAYTSFKKNDEPPFHQDTVQLMIQNARSICRRMDGPFTLIDLGPEYPDKTLPVMKYAYLMGQNFDYVPVDINEQWAFAAAEVGAPFARTAQGLTSRFETYADKIPEGLYPKRLVFIGLTFMNFPSQEILDIMKKIAGPEGVIGIAQELITPLNSPDDILERYKEVRRWAEGPIRNLGVPTQKLPFKIGFSNSRVELGFEIDEDKPELGMQKGDTVTTCVSYRRSYEEFAELLAQNTTRPEIWRSENGNTALAFASAGPA